MSAEGHTLYAELGGDAPRYDWESRRADPLLVQVVETLGRQASDRFAKLEIVEMPVGTKYLIDEYDGIESVVYRDCEIWTTA